MAKKNKIDHEAISRAVIAETSTEDLKNALEFINRLKYFRGRNKLYTTYVKGVDKAIKYNEETRVYPDFRLDQVVTGRLSCGGYNASGGKKKDKIKGVSFHTLPRDKTDSIRNMFIGEKDMPVFITGDFGQMELRVLAHLSREPNLIAAFLSGQDLHKYTASLVFQKPIEKVTDDERQIAKSVSFLIVYGGSEFKLATTANIRVKEAKKVIVAYTRAFPGIFDRMDVVKQQVRKNGYVETIFGRRRHLPHINSPFYGDVLRAERQAVNFDVQSPASDILSYCWLDLEASYKEKQIKAITKASVHDSQEAVSSLTDLKPAVEEMYRIMTTYPTLRKVMEFECVVPLKVDIEVGFSFGDGIKAKIIDGQLQNEEELKAHVIEMSKK